MSVKVASTGGGSETKVIAAPDGTILAPAVKLGNGKVTVSGGFGTVAPEKVFLGESFTTDQGFRREGTFDKDAFEQEVAEANRNGKYVWDKKVWGKIPCTITGYHTYANATVKLSSPDYDLTKLTASDFIGMLMYPEDNSVVEIISDTKYSTTGRTGTWTWDAGNSSIKLDLHLGSTIHDVRCKNTPKVIDGWASDVFVVDNSPTAYPDNGEKEGSWYEKLTEPKTIEDKIEFYINSYNGTTQSFPHDFGETPDFCGIRHVDYTDQGDGIDIISISADSQNVYIYVEGSVYRNIEITWFAVCI